MAFAHGPISLLFTVAGLIVYRGDVWVVEAETNFSESSRECRVMWQLKARMLFLTGQKTTWIKKKCVMEERFKTIPLLVLL